MLAETTTKCTSLRDYFNLKSIFLNKRNKIFIGNCCDFFVVFVLNKIHRRTIGIRYNKVNIKKK